MSLCGGGSTGAAVLERPLGCEPLEALGGSGDVGVGGPWGRWLRASNVREVPGDGAA